MNGAWVLWESRVGASECLLVGRVLSVVPW